MTVPVEKRLTCRLAGEIRGCGEVPGGAEAAEEREPRPLVTTITGETDMTTGVIIITEEVTTTTGEKDTREEAITLTTGETDTGRRGAETATDLVTGTTGDTRRMTRRP